MGLIDLQTDLKSLKYSTVPGNGTGPIIRKSIPEEQTSTIGYSIQNPFKGPGFFQAIDEDVKRVEGWFDQNRGSWAIKQATLELFNPKTEVPLINRIPDVLGINALVNTAGSPLGIHLHKNGIAGFIPEDSKYEANVRENNNDGKNRLVELTNRFIYQNNSQTFSFLGPLSGLANSISNTIGGFLGKDDPVLFSYAGGPGGPITTIRRASDQKGYNNTTYSTSFGFNPNQSTEPKSLDSSNSPFIPKNNFVNSYITSLGFESYTFENIQGNTLGSIFAKYTGSNPNANLDNPIQTDPYELGLDNITNTYSEGDNSYLEKTDGFLKPQRKNIFPSIFGINTSNKNTPRTRLNYLIQNKNEENPNVDRINLLGIGETSENIRDLIKFRFGIINNESPSNIETLQFRAYLTNFTDNFNPSWDSVKYVGRGEEFYNYTGFSRNVSFNLAFAALTRQELIPLYNKINYLASLTAPDYTDNGYIRGNIVKLTIGDYIDAQPGVIDSLSYNIEDNVMWEINLEGEDDIGQFPHVLRAQIGMKLIHNFLPKKGSTSPEKEPTSYFIGVDGQYRPFQLPIETKLRNVEPIETSLPQRQIIDNRPRPTTPPSTFNTNVPLGSEGAPLIDIPGVF